MPRWLTWLKRLWTSDEGGFVAACPECNSSHLYRLASECESRYDGEREWSRQTGARYTCAECQTVFIVRADGVRRIKPAVKAEEKGEVDKRERPARDAVMPRLPRVRP